MIMPKDGKDLRLVSNHRAGYAAVKHVAFLMPNLENVARLFAKATAFCMVNLLQGHRQIPLSPGAHSTFAVLTLGA